MVSTIAAIMDIIHIPPTINHQQDITDLMRQLLVAWIIEFKPSLDN